MDFGSSNLGKPESTFIKSVSNDEFLQIQILPKEHVLKKINSC